VEGNQPPQHLPNIRTDVHFAAWWYYVNERP